MNSQDQPVPAKRVRPARRRPVRRGAKQVAPAPRRLSLRTGLICLVLAVVMVSSVLYFLDPNRRILAATFDWVQSSWAGGADMSAVATYTSDRTTWTKYFAKSSNVVATADSLTLDNANGSITQTADADFAAGTGEEAYDTHLYIAGDSLRLKKQNGRVCTLAAECARGFCTGGVCADPYIYNSACPTIGVYPTELSGQVWQSSTGYNCPSPQCSVVGTVNTLVADNNVDFSNYPARNTCKNLKGRLPTRAELSCIYANRNVYGNNFSGNQWSSEEATYSSAYYVSNTGTIASYSKTSSYYVHCVREIP